MKRARIAVALLALGAGSAAVLAQVPTGVELSPVEPAAAAGRGTAVALDGDWLAVGASTADPSPPGLPGLAPPGGTTVRHTGAVYLFERVAGRWFERRKLTVSDGEPRDLFGAALALRHGILAVAAPGRHAGAGAVYLFAQGPESAWSQEAVLTSCGGAAASRFGRAIALDSVDGSRLAVGMTGSACVFRRNASAEPPPARVWQRELGSPVAPAPTQPGDRFGESVALRGNTLAVGAPGRNLRGGKSTGAVFLFTFTPPGDKPGAKPVWVGTGRLGQSDPKPYDQFGVSLAMSAGSPAEVLVGADGRDQGTGAAYLFNLSTLEAVELPAPAALPGQQFGAAVALDPVQGDRLAVGAPALPTVTGAGRLNSLPAGTAYVYERTPNGWVRLPPLADLRDEPLSLFGAALAVNGTDVVAAVPVADQGGGAAGSAYLFQCSGGSCTPQAELAPCDLLGTAFRATVAASGDLVAIGVTQFDQVSPPPSAPMGAVYLFRRAGQGWRQEARLLSPQADPHDGFGSAVALDGDTLAVGAPEGEQGAGAVYIFHRNGTDWSQPPTELRLLPPLAATKLGRSLALDSGIVVAGAAGAAYTFTADGAGGWGAAVALLPAQPPLRQDFGAAVALRGDTVVVGAPSSEGPGSAYVFQEGAKGWTPTATLACAPCTGDFGKAVTVDGDALVVGDPGGQAVSLFTKSTDGWSRGKALQPSPPAPGFGATVDLHGDNLAVSAPGVGAACLLHRTGDAWSGHCRVPAEGRPGFVAAALGGDFLVAAPDQIGDGTGVVVLRLADLLQGSPP